MALKHFPGNSAPSAPSNICTQSRVPSAGVNSAPGKRAVFPTNQDHRVPRVPSCPHCYLFLLIPFTYAQEKSYGNSAPLGTHSAPATRALYGTDHYPHPAPTRHPR